MCLVYIILFDVKFGTKVARYKVRQQRKTKVGKGKGGNPSTLQC